MYLIMLTVIHMERSEDNLQKESVYSLSYKPRTANLKGQREVGIGAQICNSSAWKVKAT